jgi:hypothetical protein
MSYSAPGPRRETAWERQIQRPPFEQQIPQVQRPPFERIIPRKPDVTQSAAAGDPPIDWLLTANNERHDALIAGDVALARSALQEVVADLDRMLDTVKKQLVRSTSADRQRVKRIVKDDLAAAAVAALPLGDVADLLEMSNDQVEVVIRSLRAKGAVDVAARERALAQIKHLRAQLRAVKATNDHELLDRLVSFIVKLAQALVIAVAATVAGTLAIGESLVDGLVVKTAIVALVTLALNSAATAVRERWDKRSPYAVTRESLADLTAELMKFASTSTASPAYEHEWPVARIRLLVKTCKAQQALIDTQWKHKAACWNVLGELAVILSRSVEFNADECGQSLRKLQTVQERIPKG